MDYDKLDEILSTIDYKNKEYLSPIIDIIGQIKKCKCYINGTNFNGLLFFTLCYMFLKGLIAEKTAYSHLMLR